MAAAQPSIDTGAGLERVIGRDAGRRSRITTRILFVPLIKRAAERVEGRSGKEEGGRRARRASEAASSASHRRPREGVNVPDFGWRAAGERGTRLRAAQDHPPCDSARPLAGTREAVPVRDGICAVRDMMKDAYPELVESAERVAEMIKGEEDAILRTRWISDWSGFDSNLRDVLEVRRLGSKSSCRILRRSWLPRSYEPVREILEQDRGIISRELEAGPIYSGPESVQVL